MSSLLSIPGVVPAARLERPAAPTVSCGLAAVDALVGGLPRGALTEICGPASSGRTSLLYAVLAEAARRQELCALIDVGDSFDPHSAAAAGVALKRVLWVRCGGHPAPRRETTEGRQRPQPEDESLIMPTVAGRGRGARDPWLRRVEQALKATDLLLQGGGFGVVAVDLADVPPEVARRIPLASWFRFRRAVEHTPAVLLAIEPEPYAKTCASLVLRTSVRSSALNGAPNAAGPAHARLFGGFSVEVEIVRDREPKKPARGAGTSFRTRTQWA